MPATMARQGGRVQLEQFDMCLALNMAKMAKGGFLRTAVEETQFLFKKPRAKVREEKKQGVEFPGHDNGKAVMERDPAMLREYQMNGCPPCQNGTAPNPQTRWRRKRTGAPPLEQLSQPTPEPTPHPPKTPLVPPCSNEAAHISEIKGEPPGDMYIHTPIPGAQCLNLEAYAMDRKRDKHFDPDLLTDEGTSSG